MQLQNEQEEERKKMPFLFSARSGMGSPVVGDCDGDYHYDTHKRQLQWSLPFIDASNKSGSMEFTIQGSHPGDFFPVNVSFTSRKPYCDIQVSAVFVIFSFGRGWVGAT